LLLARPARAGKQIQGGKSIMVLSAGDLLGVETGFILVRRFYQGQAPLFLVI